MKKDKRIFDGVEVLAKAQAKFETQIVQKALMIMYPNGVLIDKNKVTSESTGKIGSSGRMFVARYDGKTLFKRRQINETSYRYESPAFGDVLD